MKFMLMILLDVTGSPVVAINRATVIAQSRSPEEGLAALERIGQDQRLVAYQSFWAARAGLLSRCGHVAAAEDAYTRAIELEQDASVRRFLWDRKRRLNAANGQHDVHGPRLPSQLKPI